ncbi:MAG: DMT family transporter [Andreesenia angusta]|nr:DMT family transporter [Andreesenia angusta]
MFDDKIKLILALLIFGSIGIFVRHISMDSLDIVSWRIIIGTIFLISIYLISNRKIDKRAVIMNWKALLIGGITLASSWAFLFAAYKNTTIGMATLLYYCAPIFLFLISPFVFKEKIRKKAVIGILLAIFGMLIINWTNTEGGELSIGLVFGLISAVLYSIMILSNKFIKDMSGLDSTLIQFIVAEIVILIYKAIDGENIIVMPESGDMIFILILGLFHTGLGCYLYFTSIARLEGPTISVISYIDPLSALVFSAIFLGEKMTYIQMVGALLIFGGTALSQIKIRKRYRKRL